MVACDEAVGGMIKGAIKCSLHFATRLTRAGLRRLSCWKEGEWSRSEGRKAGGQQQPSFFLNADDPIIKSHCNLLLL
jgi:hypothetical protein